MKEICQILEAYNKIDFTKQKAALATVVHVEGSSYRQPGARMLVTDDGKLTGAISGGCLEGDALHKALLVMIQQKPMLVTYDTTNDDDAKLGIGLGCNGIIHILIEPIDPAGPDNPIGFFKTVVSQRQNAVLITLFSLQDRMGTQPGTCLLYLGEGTVAGNIPDPILQSAIVEHAIKALNSQTSSIRIFASEKHNITAFIEVVKPAVSLIIFGAGNDVIPMIEMAGILGWNTTVVDGRNNYATPERFPTAQKVLVAKPDTVLSKLTIDKHTVFLLMTHNYNYDLAILRQIVLQKIVFIGVLGPKKKLERMLGELKDEGIILNDELLSKIYGPVGLDIGAETPEEIALSILAEIKTVLSGKSQNSLRDKNETIHPRAFEEIPKVIIP